MAPINLQLINKPAFAGPSPVHIRPSLVHAIYLNLDFCFKVLPISRHCAYASVVTEASVQTNLEILPMHINGRI